MPLPIHQYIWFFMHSNVFYWEECKSCTNLFEVNHSIVQQVRAKSLPRCISSSAPNPGARAHFFPGKAEFGKWHHMEPGGSGHEWAGVSVGSCCPGQRPPDRGHQPSQHKAEDTNTPDVKHGDIRRSLGQDQGLQANIAAPGLRKRTHHAVFFMLHVEVAPSSLWGTGQQLSVTSHMPGTVMGTGHSSSDQKCPGCCPHGADNMEGTGTRDFFFP